MPNLFQTSSWYQSAFENPSRLLNIDFSTSTSLSVHVEITVPSPSQLAHPRQQRPPKILIQVSSTSSTSNYRDPQDVDFFDNYANDYFDDRSNLDNFCHYGTLSAVYFILNNENLITSHIFGYHNSRYVPIERTPDATLFSTVVIILHPQLILVAALITSNTSDITDFSILSMLLPLMLQSIQSAPAAMHPLNQQSFAAPLWPSSTPTISSPNPLGINQIASGLYGLNLSRSLNIGAMNTGAPLSSSTYVPSALAAPNVTNLVTVKLSAVEDYLTWKTQFTALLISHNLLSFVDGSFPPPPMYVSTATTQQLNP